MKQAYRMFKRSRSGIYLIQSNETGEQRSLRTKDKMTAKRLLAEHNKAHQEPAINLEMARIHARAADPKLATRTWQTAMDELSSHGKQQSQERCRREMAAKAFDGIRNKPLIQTTSDDLKLALKRGGSATNNYLRRLHNLACGNGWIFGPIIPARQWEKPPKTEKRGITLAEHRKILEAEQNAERRAYYEFLWLIGAAQTDGALMTAGHINWQRKTLSYQRKKTGEWCFLAVGEALERLLRQRPSQGYLFPKIATLSDKDRSAEFARRRRMLKLSGVSLHSYRYAWAERAAESGYLERYAQAALGHGSKAVHRAYAKKAHIICPPLESADDKIIPFNQPEQLETQLAHKTG